MTSHAKQELLSLLRRRRRKRDLERRRRRRKELGIENEVAPIQRLPDVHISYVLSKLGNSKDVAMASMVCKRWYSCTGHVQHLSFSTRLLALQKWVKQPDALGWVRLIGRCVQLTKLCICSSNYTRNGRVDTYTQDYILDCLTRANPRLEILHLDLSLFLTPKILNMVVGFHNLVELQVHNSDNLIHSKYEIIDFFLGTWKFMALKKCQLSDFHMEDGHLEDFLINCPVLEELTVSNCQGLERPTLTSGSLRKLEFLGSEIERGVALDTHQDVLGVPLLKINAPQLASLVLTYVHKVVCDSSYNLQEIHFKSWVIPCFKDLPQLHKLSIEGEYWPQNMVVRVLKQGSNAAYVLLSCCFEMTMWKLMPAEKFFYHISQVETLEISSKIYEMLLYSAGSTTFCFPRLRRLYFDADRSDDAPSKETLVKFMLDSSNLQEVVIFLRNYPICRLHVSFLKSLLNLQVAHPQVAFDVQQRKYDQKQRECICRVEFGNDKYNQLFC